MAYILLRDAEPEYIRALMAPDAMCIPARADGKGVARPAETGPVFFVSPQTGHLHMRFTARATSIEWKQEPVTLAAVEHLMAALNSDSAWILHARLSPGSGLLCNNVLHDRNEFVDAPDHKRLLFRARYLDRVG